MFATSLALLAPAFHGPRPRDRVRGLGRRRPGAAVAVGPLVGGVLTEDIGWEAIFFVNVPIGIAAIGLTLARSTSRATRTRRGVDWAGLVTFSAALFLLVFALIRGNAEGWGSPLIVGCWSARRSCSSPSCSSSAAATQPDARPVAVPQAGRSCGASLAAFALSASMFSMFLYLTLYVQNIARLLRRSRPACASCRSRCCRSSSRRSRASSPSASASAGSSAAGSLLRRGRAAAHARPRRRGDDWTALLAGFLVAGAGIGMINPRAGHRRPSASSSRSAAGMASGINSTFRQVGIATGIAALGRALPARRGRRSFARTVVGGTAAARVEDRLDRRLHLLRRLPADRPRCAERLAGGLPRGPQRDPALRRACVALVGRGAVARAHAPARLRRPRRSHRLIRGRRPPRSRGGGHRYDRAAAGTTCGACSTPA